MGDIARSPPDGAQAPVNKDIDAVNNSYGPIDRATASVRHSPAGWMRPAGFNWGQFHDAEIDALLRQAQSSVVPAEQDAVLAKVHAMVVDDAADVFVAHDLAPRAMTKQVRGYVQAQSWFSQLTSMFMAE